MPTNAEVIKQAQADIDAMRQESGHNISANAVGGLLAALIVSGAVDRLCAAIASATTAPATADGAATDTSA
jgi:hypothetical protein